MTPPDPQSLTRQFPVTPIRRWSRPLARFRERKSAGGLVLLGCMIISLGLANSPWAETVRAFWETPCGISIGTITLNGSLLHVVNDGLMTIFFFTIGLEIKRELVAGELRDPRKAVLPLAAALGGMVIPAGIYLALRHNQPDARGWGIPMATDIAFVVGVMAMLGKRVPFGLKILLLSLAIADDIGAVLVIAAVYSSHISLVMLGLAALGFALIILLTRIGARAVPVYVVLGAGIWLAFLESGVHPTVAGVLLGLITPSAPWLSETSVRDLFRSGLDRLTGGRRRDQEKILRTLEVAAQGVAPLDRQEAILHPWVGFAIMPLFALANAGVEIEMQAFANPTTHAVALGLLIGKPVGIVLFSWCSIRIGIARLPTGVSWFALLGGGFLAGIGFTMSLFIASVALDDRHLAAGKLGTLIGSACGAVIGTAILSRARGSGAVGKESNRASGTVVAQLSKYKEH